MQEIVSKEENMESTEIDLLALLEVFRGNWIKILIALLLGAALFGGYTYSFIKPTYESTAKLYIVSASNDSVVDLTDLNIGTTLTKDYEELIMSYTVLEEVIDNLNLNMNYKQLMGHLTITNPDDTRVLRITANTTDPNLSSDIANELMKAVRKYLPETMNVDAPNVAEKARPNYQKVAPSNFKNALIGGFLGALLCMGYLTVMYVMDDSVHTVEDMEKFFGEAPLTSIPENEMFAKLDEDDSQKITNAQDRRYRHRHHKRKK